MFLISLLSIFLVSRSAQGRLEDKMRTSSLLYPSNTLFWRSITISSLNSPEFCSSKDNQVLVVKKYRNGYNFGSEASTRGKLIFVFCLLGLKKHVNSQMNGISRLLTAVSISSTLFPTLMCQRFTPRVALPLGAARFLYTSPLSSFPPHLLHLFRLQQLKLVYNPLMKAIQEVKAFFASRVDDRDHLRLERSRMAS